MIDEFEFILSKEIEYQKNGQNDWKSKSLIIKAPCANNIKYVSKIESYFYESINKIKDIKENNQSVINENKKDLKLNGNQIVMMMNMSGIDMSKVYENFKDLLLHETCKVDDEQKLTSFLLDKISFYDIRKLLGKYIENFIISSLEEATEIL